MNAKQRRKNRETASHLEYTRNTCPECVRRGKHWVQMPQSLVDVLTGVPAQGFWTCDKFYGPDGRRLEGAA